MDQALIERLSAEAAQRARTYVGPAFLSTFAALVRREALEEAAKVCEALADHAVTMRWRTWPEPQECAAAIRALISQPEQ